MPTTFQAQTEPQLVDASSLSISYEPENNSLDEQDQLEFFKTIPLNALKREIEERRVMPSELVNAALALQERGQLFEGDTLSKLAEANRYANSIGFRWSDLDLPQMGKTLLTSVKSFFEMGAKAAGMPVRAVRSLVAPEYQKEDVAAAKELTAATELAFRGAIELGEKAGSKALRAVGLMTPWEKMTPQQATEAFLSQMEEAKKMASVASGSGGLTGKLFEGLDAEIDPQKVSELALGEPLTFVAIGNAFSLVGKFGGKVIGTAASKEAAAAAALRYNRLLSSMKAPAAPELSAAATAAEGAPFKISAVGKGVVGETTGEALQKASLEAAGPRTVLGLAAEGAEELGKGVSEGAKIVAEKAGRVAERVFGKLFVSAMNTASDAAAVGAWGLSASRVVAPAAGAIAGYTKAGIPGLIVGTVAGAAAARPIVAIAKGLAERGRGLAAASRKLGEEGPSALTGGARALYDVGVTSPKVVTGAAKGFLANDLPLAMMVSENPEDTKHAPLFGAALGALHGVGVVGKAFAEGQIFGEKPWRQQTEGYAVRPYGYFPELDAVSSAAVASLPVEQKARFGALKAALSGVGQLYYIPRDQIQSLLPRLLYKDRPLSKEQLAEIELFAEQGGFYLPDGLTDPAGKPIKAAFVSDIPAAPHESFHVIQDALGDAGNAAVDRMVMTEYGPIWEDLGSRYAQRVVGEGDYAYRVARGQDWREIIREVSGGADPDVYLAREIAAEHFDALFNASPTAELLNTPGFVGKLARGVAKLYSVFNSVPTGPESSNVGVPLSTEVLNRIRATADKLFEKVTPAEEKAARAGAGGRVGQLEPMPGAPAPKIATAKGEKVASKPIPVELYPSLATELRAAGKPAEAEVLDVIHEAVKRDGTRTFTITYRSVKHEEGTGVSRSQEREAHEEAYIKEALGNLPEDVRKLVVKTHGHIKLEKTAKSGWQSVGNSLERFFANADWLAKELIRVNRTDLSPYAIDVAKQTFTPDAWRQMWQDYQKYLHNHSGGWRGDGSAPVRAPEGLYAGVSRAELNLDLPPNLATISDWKPIPIPERISDWFNLLYGQSVGPPMSLRISRPAAYPGARKVPANIAARAVAEATEPGRVKAPASPRAEGKEFAGFPGYSIVELNPLRFEMERAGVPMWEMRDVIERLNLNNIERIVPRPDVAFRDTSTDILRAGFAPRRRSAEELPYDPITGAAVRDSKGRVYVGFFHPLIRRMLGIAYEDASAVDGFVTASGRFLDRNQAYRYALRTGQVSRELHEDTAGGFSPYLETDTFSFAQEKQRPDVGRVVGAAVRLPTGEVYSSFTFPEIYSRLNLPPGTLEEGFLTSSRRFVPLDRAKETLFLPEDKRDRSVYTKLSTLPDPVPPDKLKVVADYTPIPAKAFAPRARRDDEPVVFTGHAIRLEDGTVLSGLRPPKNVKDFETGYITDQGEFVPATATVNKYAVFLGGVAARNAITGDVVAAPTAELLDKRLASLKGTWERGYLSDESVFIPQQEVSKFVVSRPASAYLEAVVSFDGKAKAKGNVPEEGPWDANKDPLVASAVRWPDGQVISAGSPVEARQRRPGLYDDALLGLEGYVTKSGRFLTHDEVRRALEAPADVAGVFSGERSFSPRQERKPKESYLFEIPKGADFVKLWILPDGELVRVNRFHEDYIRENYNKLAERFGLEEKRAMTEPREEALSSNFIRINYAVRNGELSIEATREGFRNAKKEIEAFVFDNAGKIDSIDISIFDDSVTRVIDGDYLQLFKLPRQQRDKEFLDAVEVMTKADTVSLVPEEGAASIGPSLRARLAASETAAAAAARNPKVEPVSMDEKIIYFASTGERYRVKGNVQFSPSRVAEEVAKIQSGESEGQTFSRDGSVWSPKGPSLVVSLLSKNFPLRGLKPEAVAEAAAKFQRAAITDDVVFGLFKFNRGGEDYVSLDLNVVLPKSKQDLATKFARDNEQIAIWDAEHAKSVNVGGSGDAVLTKVSEAFLAADLLLRGHEYPISYIKELASGNLPKELPPKGSLAYETYRKLKLEKESEKYAQETLALALETPAKPEVVGKIRGSLLGEVARRVNEELLDGPVWFNASGPAGRTFGDTIKAPWVVFFASEKGFAKDPGNLVEWAQKITPVAEKFPGLRWVVTPDGRVVAGAFVKKDLFVKNEKTFKELGWKVVNPDKVDSGLANLPQDSPQLARLVLSNLEGEITMSADLARATVADIARFKEVLNSTEDWFAPYKLAETDLSSYSRREIEEMFPDVIMPRKGTALSQAIAVTASPLYKKATQGLRGEARYQAAVEAFANRLAAEAAKYSDTKLFKYGKDWYPKVASFLKKNFGEDAGLFAELLAASSRRASMSSNFQYAIEAWRNYRAGLYDKKIALFLEGLDKLKSGELLNRYSEQILAGGKSAESISPAQLMAAWIKEHDLLPRQSNGALYGMNSLEILRVLAGQWKGGQKVDAFKRNMIGDYSPVTVDVWVARQLRRLAFEGEQRWRLLPEDETAPNDWENAFAQAVYRKAANKLGMKPAEFQAAMWFVERGLWSYQGWARVRVTDIKDALSKLNIKKETKGGE